MSERPKSINELNNCACVPPPGDDFRQELEQLARERRSVLASASSGSAPIYSRRSCKQRGIPRHDVLRHAHFCCSIYFHQHNPHGCGIFGCVFSWYACWIQRRADHHPHRHHNQQNHLYCCAKHTGMAESRVQPFEKKCLY